MNPPVSPASPTELPPPPPEVAASFPHAAEGLQRYAALLAGPGTERGLVGPREIPRLWDRHVLNCAVVADLLPAQARVLDVGSGAGLPGLVLALVRPDVEVLLVEPLLRRSTFLEEAVAELGLAARVQVRRARADDLVGDLLVDVVTARAVAPMDRLAAWCLPLARVGGELLALKGSRVADELGPAGPTITAWGGGRPEVLTVGAGIVDPPTTVVRVPRPTIGPAAARAAAARPGRRSGRPASR